MSAVHADDWSAAAARAVPRTRSEGEFMNVDARLFGLLLQALRRRLGDGLLSPEAVNRLRDLAAEAEAVYRQAIAESKKEKQS